MVLSSEEIKNRCVNRKKGEKPLISPVVESAFEGNPAKVELRLGKYCYCSSNEREIVDLEKEEKVLIQPNEIFLFQTREKISMPEDLSGKMSLKMKWISKGLLMPSQTQIDPGYSNVLFGMLYNLSSNSIELSYEEAIVTVELAQTMKSKSISYRGQMKTMTFESFVKSRITSSLGTLEKEIEKSKKALNRSVKLWNTILTSISVAVGIVAVIVAVTAIVGAESKAAEIAILEEQVKNLEIIVEDQRTALDKYEEELDGLKIIWGNNSTYTSANGEADE